MPARPIIAMPLKPRAAPAFALVSEALQK